jgi:formylglycine-generating enzyme required for sulfatase activity
VPQQSTDYIFMSYSRRDDAVMRRIVTFLREQGIKVWVDNEELNPGTPVWEKEIEKAIQGASAVVVVLSPDSKDSEWVRREITLADQYEKRVFPLLVRGDEKSSISLRLIGRQYVDIRSNEDAGLNLVSAALLRYLEDLNEQEQSAKKKASSLTVQKADEERIALEKFVADRKARGEADRLAVQKAELDSKEKLAREKAERETAAKVAREKLAKPSANLLPIVENKNVSKNNLRLFGIGGLILFVLICGGFGLNYLIRNLPVATATVPSTNDTPTFELATLTDVPLTPTPLPTETPILTPDLGVGSTEISPKDGMTLLYVPAGEFTMGYAYEGPIHKVTLDAYWIDQTDVTNTMYANCVSVGQCSPPSDTTRYSNSNYANHPVVYVSWNDALAYCSWAERRLPTEAEWEKAARGTKANIYPWGNESPNASLLNYNRNVGDTTEVGKYPNGKSFYGAYDMAGNVHQWVNDWFSNTYYQNSPLSNPLGPDTGQYRVIRGSSWPSEKREELFSANRTYYSPDSTNGDLLGFRCARGTSP